MITPGLKHTSYLTVSQPTTAAEVGSGDLAVLATPMLIALMENAAMMAVKDHISEGETTVGGFISTSHLKPSKVGEQVRAEAEVVKAEGRKIEFKVAAYMGETLIGEGTHIRFVVDRERFMK